MFNLSIAAELHRVVTAQAISTGVNSDSVDLRDYDGACFVAQFGALSGTATVKLQQSDDDGVSDDFTDMSGTVVAGATDDDKMVVFDIIRPSKRYIRAVVSGQALDEIDSVLAILYMPRVQPVTQGSTVAATNLKVSPVEV